MIYTMSVKDFKQSKLHFDKVYLIVRSVATLEKRHDEILTRAEQLAVLSPSSDLFYAYRDWYNKGEWGIEKFEKSYRPRFEAQLAGDKTAQQWLKELAASSRKENIALLCFCDSFKTCHRKIVGERLKALGGAVAIG